MSISKRTVSALRCALESERSEVKAADAVIDAYRLADRRLRRSIEEIAIPALRRFELEGCPFASEERRSLEEALPNHVDEERIRSRRRRADGWH